MEAACLRLYIKAAHKCYEGEEDYYSGVGFFLPGMADVSCLPCD